MELQGSGGRGEGTREDNPASWISPVGQGLISTQLTGAAKPLSPEMYIISPGLEHPHTNCDPCLAVTISLLTHMEPNLHPDGL